MDKSTFQALIPIAVIAVIYFFRLRNMKRARRFRTRLLWIAPALYALMVAAILVVMPPAPLGWGLFAAGLAAGCLVGWQRARLMKLEIDPQTREMTIRQSPAAMLLLLGIFVLRRMFAPSGAVAAGAGHALPASALLATDALLGFALGMIVMTRVELWLRARALHLSATAAVFADGEGA